MMLVGSTNIEYHADRTCLSSSMLKAILKDPNQFYSDYILGNKLQEEKAHFTEGSFVHAALLEPETIAARFPIFPGLRKAGKVWEQFKAEHPNQEVLSAAQLMRCERLVRAFQALPVAVNMLKGCQTEHTMTGEIMGVKVKARADAINIEQGYITDVKTTSMPSEADFFRNTIKDYSYQLSAALYCEIAKQTYGKPFDFYWQVLSNADNVAEVYKAKESTLAEGTVLYTQAISLYKHCLETGIWAPKEKQNLIRNEDYEVIEL